MFWSTINNGAIQLLNIIIGIFLARLLTPADYGIVGVLSIFTLLAGNIQSSGFTQGLINMKSPQARDYNAVFWFNIIASVAVYVILFSCAPLIAAYFKQPIIVSVSRFVFLGFVIAAFGIAHNGYMIKNMMNREIAVINVVAMIVSGAVGITLAVKGYAYWSLAWQQILYIFVLNVGRYYYVSWRPSIRVDFSPLRRMFSFSVKILITNIVSTLSNNVLTFIFGRIFTIRQVGNYTQANKWGSMASTFVAGTIQQIAQTVLVEVNDEKERELRVFRKMLRFTAFLSFPIMIGLAAVSREFILVTITDAWADSIPLMQVLCLGMAFLPIHVLLQNLAISAGKSSTFMWCCTSFIVAQILIIIILKSYSMLIIVCGYSVLFVVWIAVWFLATRKIINLRLVDFLKDIVPFFLISAAVIVMVWIITLPIHNLTMLLVTRVILSSALYFAIMKLARVKILDECVNFLFRR